MTATLLTEAEKEKIRYYLGYIETSMAASVQFGLARPIQTVFILEDAMTLLTNANAYARVQQILATLDSIECQLAKAVQTLAASSLGDMDLHPLKAKGLLFTDSIEREYVRWASRLADVMGVPLYAYSSRFRKRGPGTSIPVS